MLYITLTKDWKQANFIKRISGGGGSSLLGLFTSGKDFTVDAGIEKEYMGNKNSRVGRKHERLGGCGSIL